MFTGIIEELGVVKKIQSQRNLLTLTIAAKKVIAKTKIGDSIAIDGVCLTVTRIKGTQLTFDLMKETLDCTTFQFLKSGQHVNLERALRAGDPLGGHFVTGHIDGMGEIKKIVNLENYVEYRIEAPKPLARYFVPKGSVSVHGISLTVGKVFGNIFSVYLIPHTLAMTNIQGKHVGNKVNIETDVLAKYILKRDSKGE